MASPRVLGPNDGHLATLGGTGARLIIEGDDADKRFALVEHPMQPRALGAPMHRHHREDEYSFVLEGSIGALLGDSVVIGNPGDLIFKPREQWHTFWNAGGAPARVLEIISPAGFENYFREATQVAQGLAQELSLWTFQRNLVARRFYEQHGFLLVDETDGARNEEMSLMRCTLGDRLRKPKTARIWPRAVASLLRAKGIRCRSNLPVRVILKKVDASNLLEQIIADSITTLMINGPVARCAVSARPAVPGNLLATYASYLKS
jgi:mannose-6-phosphate isomerase-like protein (cupin superfamily)